MNTGTILAHKHTLYETFAGFFRALATESFSAVRQWLHPELERLIFDQCQRNGETSFLRSLRHGLGSATQRLRLGGSTPMGAGEIRTELVTATGEKAGRVRFVLSNDGWRIYAVEVWTDSRKNVKSPPPQRKGPQKQSPIPVARAINPQASSAKKKPPKVLSRKWFSKFRSSG